MSKQIWAARRPTLGPRAQILVKSHEFSGAVPK